MKPYVIVAALSAALGLTACNAPARTGGNAGICVDLKAAKPVAAPGSPGAGGAAAVDECVMRWAYSLAPSRDDADLVAEAVKSACSTQLAAWNQQSVNQPGAEGASLLTGEPTTPLAEHNSYVARRALFYVVQARAGSCAAPPAKAGAPVGVG